MMTSVLGQSQFIIVEFAHRAPGYYNFMRHQYLEKDRSVTQHCLERRLLIRNLTLECVFERACVVAHVRVHLSAFE